jgi:hypothetical protein
MSYQVQEYTKNGKKRYKVLGVPIFAAAGMHTLTDGTEMNFDEDYVIESAKRTSELESKSEIRPVHLFHWDFDREDGMPPDANCPNFAFLENVKLAERNERKEVISDITDLTWKDLNRLPKYGGRSVQILNPETQKIDSLAFLPSIPPKVKGLGRIELDLSNVKPPENKEDLNESYIDNPIVPDFLNTINFSERKHKKLAIILFKENEMPKKKDELLETPEEETEVQDDFEQETADDEFIDEGGGEEEIVDEGGEETFDDIPEEDEYEEVEEEDDEEPVTELTVDDLKDVIEEALDKKLDEKLSAFLKDIKIMNLEGDKGSQAGGVPQASVGFSEVQKTKVAAFFGSENARVANKPRMYINEHGAEVWEASQPVMQQVIDLEQQAVVAASKGDVKATSAAFAEIHKLIEGSIAPTVGRPKTLSKIDKMILKKKQTADMPEELKAYPKASEFWEEWKDAKSIEKQNGVTRAPAFYQEHKTGNKTKIASFCSYYNNYAKQEGITQIIPLNVIENLEKKELSTNK